jgi:hypothetical protein
VSEIRAHKIKYKVRPLNPIDTQKWWDAELDIKIPCAGLDVIPTDDSVIDLSTLDHKVTTSVSMWISGDVGDGESCQHMRNDALLKFLRLLSGLNSISRHNHETSTCGSTRSDATLKYNGVPLVNIEEKELRIDKAAEDLSKKFCWIPHFASLPFIFGFAITFTEMRVFCMTPTSAWQNAPIINIGLMDFNDRILCLKYIVNIARVLRYFIDSSAIAGSSIPFEQWSVRSSKSLRLSSRYVEHRFDEVEKYDEMKEFYSTLQELRVPHVESLYEEKPFDDVKRIIRLQPVGVERTPNTIEELRSSLRCVYLFLQRLHAAGFMHCDIRWSNIVWVWGQWFVIDCTEAIRCDAEPSKLVEKSKKIRGTYVFDTEGPWSTRHDYYQFGKLIHSTKVDVTAGSDLALVSSMLTDKAIPDVDVNYLNSIFIV